METNLLPSPLQYCRCKTSLSLRLCVVFRGPWKKANICESKSSIEIGRNGRGPGIHVHCLPRGFLGVPHSTFKLHSSLSLSITRSAVPWECVWGENGYMGNRAKLQYLLIIFQFLECKIYWCETEIARDRIHFVMEVFISYQQLRKSKLLGLVLVCVLNCWILQGCSRKWWLAGLILCLWRERVCLCLHCLWHLFVFLPFELRVHHWKHGLSSLGCEVEQGLSWNSSQDKYCWTWIFKNFLFRADNWFFFSSQFFILVQLGRNSKCLVVPNVLICNYSAVTLSCQLSSSQGVPRGGGSNLWMHCWRASKRVVFDLSLDKQCWDDSPPWSGYNDRSQKKRKTWVCQAELQFIRNI